MVSSAASVTSVAVLSDIHGVLPALEAVLADGAVTLRRTVYDAEAACAAIADQSGYPDVAEWADYFVHARATDADALGAFAPRDGRAQL